MGSARPGWPRRSSRRAGSRQRARLAVPPRRAGRAWRGMLLRLRWLGGGASSDTGAVSVGWVVRTDHLAMGPQTDAVAAAGLDDSPPVDPGTSGTGGGAPPAPATFVLAPGVFRYLASQQTLWPASKPWGWGSAKRQCRARQQRVRSMGACWRDPVPKPLPSSLRRCRSEPKHPEFDDQITWATAMRTAPDLACAIAVGYSVSVWIAPKQ